MVLETEQREVKFFGHNIIYYVSQVIIAIALFAVCCRLFCMQAYEYPGALGNHVSDLPAHIRFGIEGRGYSLLYIIIGVLARTFGYEAVCVFESVLVVLTWYCAVRLIEKVSGFYSIVSLYVSLGLIFLTTINLPGIYGFYYTGSIITQPWHNITYIAMRLFAVLTVSCFIDLYKNYPGCVRLRDYALVSIFLFLSACMKPNFLVSFSLALLIVLIVDFAKDRRRWENLRNYVIIGSTVFPSLAVLYLQSRILYPQGIGGGEETSGLALAWFPGFFSQGVGTTVLKLILCLAFPVIVLAMNKGGSRMDRFIVLLYLVSFAIVNLLHETGPRQNHGNFYWCIYGAGYLLFLISASLFLKNWREGFPEGRKSALVYKISCAALFACHVISGLFYFNLLLRGSGYGI